MRFLALSSILISSFFTASLSAQTYPVMRVIQKDFPDMIGYFPPFMVFPLCGVGSEYFDRDSWASTTSASVVNSSFSPIAPTLTTMNQSGCKGPKSIVENAPVDDFTKDNMTILAMDISKGEGESLDTLAELLKLKLDDVPRFKEALKRHFKLLFPTSDVGAAELLNNIAWVMSLENVSSPLVRNYTPAEVLQL